MPNGNKIPPPANRAQREALSAATGAVASGLSAQLQPPERPLGEDLVRHAYGVDDDRRVHLFAPHMRKMFDSMSEEDAQRLTRLMALRPTTIDWIDGKNEKELKNLDGTIELISSSRTAGKVLFWVGGACVSIIGAAVALAKNGYDIFVLIRGLK